MDHDDNDNDNDNDDDDDVGTNSNQEEDVKRQPGDSPGGGEDCQGVHGLPPAAPDHLVPLLHPHHGLRPHSSHLHQPEPLLRGVQPGHAVRPAVCPAARLQEQEGEAGALLHVRPPVRGHAYTSPGQETRQEQVSEGGHEDQEQREADQELQQFLGRTEWEERPDQVWGRSEPAGVTPVLNRLLSEILLLLGISHYGSSNRTSQICFSKHSWPAFRGYILIISVQHIGTCIMNLKYILGLFLVVLTFTEVLYTGCI